MDICLERCLERLMDDEMGGGEMNGGWMDKGLDERIIGKRDG